MLCYHCVFSFPVCSSLTLSVIFLDLSAFLLTLSDAHMQTATGSLFSCAGVSFLCFPFISLLPLSLCLLLDLLFPFWFVFVSFPFSKKFSFSVLHLVKTPSSTNHHKASALSPWIIHLSTRERHHISRLTCCPLALCQKLQVYLPFLP